VKLRERRADSTSPLWVVQAGIVRVALERSEPVRASSDAVAIASLVLKCCGPPLFDTVPWHSSQTQKTPQRRNRGGASVPSERAMGFEPTTLSLEG
jgi:hypothetical protein